MRNHRLKTVIGLIAFFVLVSCARDMVTGKSSYNWFSIKTDEKLGDQVMTSQLKALEKKDKPIDKKADKRMYKKMHKVAFDIAKVSHVREFPWEFHLADVDVVNAWAAPGGKIMVYTGLYNNKKKALVDPKRTDEMAAVLAHEIAHATARHVTEALSTSYTIMLAGTAASTAVSAVGSATASNVFHNVFSHGINVFIPTYTRKNEAEADKIGLFYMATAGYDPRAARDLWYRACKKRGDRYSIYSSHPSSCQRAKNLEKYMPQALEIYNDVKAGRDVPIPPQIPD